MCRSLKMCGMCVIFRLSFAHEKSQKQDSMSESPWASDFITELLVRRGPDHHHTYIVDNEKYYIGFFGTVLHLRGTVLAVQPFHRNEDVLLWNGEIFGNIEVPADQSDTTFLAELLTLNESVEKFLQFFSELQGPWAFIFFQKNQSRLWFGRDIFGRRSLLWKRERCQMVLSSVSSSEGAWEEVPADGLYCLDVGKSVRDGYLVLEQYSWMKPARALPEQSGIQTQHICRENPGASCLHSPISVPLNRAMPEEKDILEHKLDVNILPCLDNNSALKAADQSSVLEGISSLSVDTHSEYLIPSSLLTLYSNSSHKELVENFIEVLGNAVCQRVLSSLLLCKVCSSFLPKCLDSDLRCKVPVHERENISCQHASTALLFSGGLDSIVLAALANRYVPYDIPIDLLNVAFEHASGVDVLSKKHSSKKRGKSHCIPRSSSYEAPDRLTGRRGVQELRTIFPGRTWNFVEINVTKEELQTVRGDHICHLIHPACTILDDSLGCAMWFAARGTGLLHLSDGSTVTYTSPAKVVLVGTGADEQLGGYSRHRSKFKSAGWIGVLDEIEMEMDRISSRNLGRDDRIISDHGREARFPYLDENVVNFLNAIPLWQKANLFAPRGVGEKLILRLAAYHLGLKQSSIETKRAMQFGSRIAHLEDRKEKGSQICNRLSKNDVNS